MAHTVSAQRSGQPTGSGARERLISAAYELFSHHGVRAVGVNAIIERSGVARQTMYRHFGSKQDLVIAFLERREQLWTRDWLEAEVQRRATTPDARLLAIFDVLDGWFRGADFEGCSFINVMLEHPDRSDPVHRAATAYLARIQQLVEDLARRAGIADAEGFAREWQILLLGSSVAARAGDRDAALRAKKIAIGLLEQAKPPAETRPASRAHSRLDSRPTAP